MRTEARVYMIDSALFIEYSLDCSINGDSLVDTRCTQKYFSAMDLC